MNDKVEGAYFGAWGELRRLMRQQGMPPKVVDAMRHEIHLKVLGRDKSHTKFTDAETNAVIKRFRELSGSLDFTDYEQGARLWVIREICRELTAGDPDAYAQGIIDQMDGEGRLLAGPLQRLLGQTEGEREMMKWDAELRRDQAKHRRLLHQLAPEELDKVIIALRVHTFAEAGAEAGAAGAGGGAVLSAVNHPSHYNVGSIEVIDAIEDWSLNFSLGNTVKYIARADHKNNPIEDLEKAAWYLAREISRRKQQHEKLSRSTS